MLDGKQYFGHFPDEEPDREQMFLHSPQLLETLRALEKELRAYIPTSAETEADVDDATP